MLLKEAVINGIRYPVIDAVKDLSWHKIKTHFKTLK